MILTKSITRLLAGVVLGAAAFVPAMVLSPSAVGATAASPPPCIAGQEVPVPILGEDGAIVGVNCVPCENLPEGIPGCPPPPECDPETELCEPPECDPETEECGDPETEEPEGEPGPEPVDPPVVSEPNFTG